VVSGETGFLQESDMKWTTPKVVEICVGMEINCYACAEI
jgi:coenzyme PQQ precursor peptide PqqA